MKQVCLYCNRTAPDNNMWCQEKNCPAEKSPNVLNYGEQIGDMEIVKLVSPLRTSTLYEAQRRVKGKDQKVLLKIAHEGFHERLKREAEFLMKAANVKGPRTPLLPVLLPAHPQATLHEHPYGKTVFRGEGKYYCVYEHIVAESLNDLLLKNPQPWYQHVAWLVMSLAEVIATLHANGLYHLCLSPEVILVRFDKENIPRPVLIDLGLASSQQDVPVHWNNYHILPVYTAPELIQNPHRISGEQIDVYGLGMLLYELLAGHPAYQFKFRTEADIYASILDRNAPPSPISRPDLTKDIPQIAQKAISQEGSRRHQTVVDLGRELKQFFPQGVPIERKDRRINWQSVAIVAGVLLAIMLLIIMAVSLTQITA